jgi:spermidine synthase
LTHDQKTADGAPSLGEGALRPRDALALLCFFLSGCAGLIYQIAWIRRSALVFGSTTLAVSTVVGVFFLGLAAGSYVFGRIGTKTRRPLRLFAFMELAVGGLALLSLPAFDLANGIYGAAYGILEDRPALLFMARILIVSAVLLPPTFLMGGTLPLLCRQFVARKARIARSVGVLYGVNTLGAAAGCALAGFWLLPALGLRGSVLTGAAFSAVAGVAALALRMSVHPAQTTAAGKETRASPPRGDRLVMALFFLSGFASLAHEVLWTRYLSLLVRNTVHTYTLTLTVVLLGIVLGSFLAGAVCDKRLSRAFAFGLLQVLTGLSVLTVMMLPRPVWDGLGQSLWIRAILLLPPTILSGASFPLAVRMVVEAPSSAALGVGRMAALNTAGGILGSFFAGFAALPSLGLQTTLLLTTGLGLAAGFVAWIRLDFATPRPARWGMIAAALSAWILIPRAFGTDIPADFLASGETILLDYEEGTASNVAVVLRNEAKQMEIDRLWQGEDRKNHQSLAAHVPMALHPDPERALVVGAGAGQTPSRFLMYPVERLTCVDIEPAVFDVIRDNFPSQWMEDPRVRLITDDGRSFLAHSKETFDVVSLEVGQIYRPGVAFFYTSEFYEEVRERLNPGGVVSQFVPLPFFTTDQFRAVVRTFTEVFPGSFLWYNTSELLLIGAEGSAPRVDPGRLTGLLASEALQEDLAYSHWGGPDVWLRKPEVFLAGFLMGPKGLAEIGAGADLLSDDRPILDYATRDVLERDVRESPNLELLRRHLEPVGRYALPHVGEDLADAIERIREKNLDDVNAAAMVRQATLWIPTGDDVRIASLLSEALRWNPENFDALRMLGDARALQGRFEEALSLYERAVLLRDGDLRARRGLGSTLLWTGRTEDAIGHLRRALEIRPSDPESHNNLGVALAQRGDVEEAIRHFEEAARLRPGYLDAERNLALAKSSPGGPAPSVTPGEAP